MEQLLAESDEPPSPAPPAAPLAPTSRLQLSDSSTSAPPPPPPPGGPQEQSEKQGSIAEPTFQCFLRPARPNAQTASVPRPSTGDGPPPKPDFQCFLRPRKVRGDTDTTKERLQASDHLVGPASTPFAAFGGAQPAGTGGTFLGPVPAVLSALAYPAYHINSHGSNQPYMWFPPPTFPSAPPAPFGAFGTAFSSSEVFGGPASRFDSFASSSAGSIRHPSSSGFGEAATSGTVEQHQGADPAVTTWKGASDATGAYGACGAASTQDLTRLTNICSSVVSRGRCGDRRPGRSRGGGTRPLHHGPADCRSRHHSITRL